MVVCAGTRPSTSFVNWPMFIPRLLSHVKIPGSLLL